VAGAVAGAIENPDSIGKAYNVTGVNASIFDALTIWKRLAGAGPRLIRVPVPLTMGFDDADAVRDLGFSARSLEEGIQDVLRHPIATELT
jgi:nucleoside-diphosphate-sugar epimerase